MGATVSGKSAALSTCSSASIEEVCAAIDELIGVPTDCQQWVVDGEEISLHECRVLADTQICHGDVITVAHSGFVPLGRLPETFRLDLTSARERFSSRYSSAFTIIYKVYANVPEGRMSLEPWRKNDHDRCVYDTKAGTVTSMQGHWMAGSSESTTPLSGNDPLGALAGAWHGPAKRIQKESELFWRGASGSDKKEKEEHEEWRGRDDEEEQTSPNYSAVPGWFTLPSEDCAEIEVNLPFAGKRISRLLIDGEGRPVRAAMHGCKLGMLHQDIEEYDVQIRAVDATECI